MAFAVSPFTVSSATPVSSVAVAATLALPDNCHTVVFYNKSTTVPGLVGQVAPGTPMVAGANAMTLPAGASLTVALGTIAQRGVMDFGYGSTGVGALPIEVLYLCTFGPI